MGYAIIQRPIVCQPHPNQTAEECSRFSYPIQTEEGMYYDNNLALVQDYPSPDGIWELVEKIGEYMQSLNLKHFILHLL